MEASSSCIWRAHYRNGIYFDEIIKDSERAMIAFNSQVHRHNIWDCVWITNSTRLLFSLSTLGRATWERWFLLLPRHSCVRLTAEYFTRQKTKKGVWRFVNSIYLILNYWDYVLCPSSRILNTRKHNVSKTGSLSILGLDGDTSTQ
jgi:hypothetical protein